MKKHWLLAGVMGIGLGAGTAAAVWAAEEGGEVKMKLPDCPPAVQKTLGDLAKGATLDSVDKETEHGKTVYSADLMIDGKKYEVTVSADGSLLEKKADEEGDEVKVKFADAPAAVQATLQEQAKGAKIETLDKETKDGKTIYEADAMIDGKNYEIKVAEDGKLISKAIDTEDEKGEKK